MTGKRLILWLPFAVVALGLVLLWVGLTRPEDRTIKSQLVGKPLPAFALAASLPAQAGIASTDYADGKPRLINVFASWCVPCVVEIPVLVKLQQAGVEIDGIAVHDKRADLEAFLARNGNPYRRIGDDHSGRAQIALGSAGVPESFVVDGRGTVIYQHIGVVSERDVPKLLAMLKPAP